MGGQQGGGWGGGTLIVSLVGVADSIRFPVSFGVVDASSHAAGQKFVHACVSARVSAYASVLCRYETACIGMRMR
jgi:hypothetical protein